MFSYWEQQSFLHYDHVIAGAGLVGLNLAIDIRARFPKDSVLVLERGLIAAGASTRNAGFACMGSATELLDDLKHASENEVASLFHARKKGLEMLRERLGDDRIGYRANGSHELISSLESSALDKLDYLNDLLLPYTGKSAFRLASERIEAFGFSSYVTALVENTCEGEIHTGRMMRALTDLALHVGVEIKTGAEVASFDEADDLVYLQVKDPFTSTIWPISCRSFSVCTNAFAPQLLPRVDVVPGRGQVLITHPVQGLRIKGIFHFDRGYYYFREIDGRVLFGGGRHLDKETEQTFDFSLNPLIQIDLEQKLADIILPGQHFQVAQRWTGIMAFGQGKAPVVQAFSKRVFGAFRMGGMGVALGSEAAARLAGIIVNSIK